MSIFLNIAVILLELWASRMIWNRKWMNFVFYTQLSNFLTLLSSTAYLIAGGDAAWFRYLSVCMMVMTALVTAFILVPMGGDPKQLLWGGNGLYHHVLCPVITTVSYLFFEPRVGLAWMWLPVAVTLVYGLIMLWLNWKRAVDGPYPFFRVHNQSAGATVIWTAALVGAIGVISALLCLGA